MNSVENNELSKEDKQSLANAIATVEVEGSIVTEAEIKILEDYLKGILTEADVLKILNTKIPINK